MTRWPAAERIAEGLLLEHADTLETAVARWAVAYEQLVRFRPSEPECEAATAVLRQRIDGVLPPPPSISGVFARDIDLVRLD